MKILVIEDKAADQKSAREMLAGHDVMIASSFNEAQTALQVLPFQFEVVIINMLLPKVDECGEFTFYQPREKVPYGLTLALLAALRGAKYVALVTEARYDHDAVSVAINDIVQWNEDADRCIPNFTINGATCMFVHATSVDGTKDWASILRDLLS